MKIQRQTLGSLCEQQESRRKLAWLVLVLMKKMFSFLFFFLLTKRKEEKHWLMHTEHFLWAMYLVPCYLSPIALKVFSFYI